MLTLEDYLALLRPLEKLGFIYNIIAEPCDDDDENNFVIVYHVNAQPTTDFVECFYTDALFHLFSQTAKSVVVGTFDITVII